MPEQSPPQSPRPDQPTPPSSTTRSAGANQPTGRSTPPGGTPGSWADVPQPGYAAGRIPAQGQAFVSGGFGPAPGRPVPASSDGRAVPGYGPAVSPPGYAPGTAPFPSGLPQGAARPRQALGAPAAVATAVAAASAPKKPDLTVNKLIAGAGAAATSAVLGSFFGALGTVSGAAVGSVFSAVVTALYQRSLDKTRETVKARVKLPGGRTVKVSSTTEVPAPQAAADGASTRVFVTPGDQATEVLSAVPTVDAGPPRSRRRLLVMTGFTVVVFAIGMLAITGIELVKGSPLNTSSTTSQRSGGTSLGSVLDGGSGSAGTAGTGTSTEKATPTRTTSEEPTTETTTSKAPSDGTTTSAGPRSGFGADEQPTTGTRSTRATPTPTPTPGSGANGQSGQVGGGGAAQQDGGAPVPQQ